MKKKLMAGLVVLALTLGTAPAWAVRELSDYELDTVTAGSAGSAELTPDGLRFQFERDNGRGRSISGEGDIAVRELPLPAGTVGSLVLKDNAQGNLRAFINVNAVNSLVQVLVNLNVNVNSTVGTVRQINLTP